MESINRGVEVRRIHIVYFLCRNGAIEQPHLVRVHHLHYRGVHLRDVKRWLSELRGHDMPDSFAWSYKRRYRGCCVWQDLSDDDLITPISDNEYVLKGSLLPSLSKTMYPFFASEEKKQMKEKEEATKTAPETLQMDGSISPKQPPQADESSRPPQLPPLGSEEKASAAKSSFFSMGSWKREKRGNEFISNGENVRSDAGSHRQAAISVIRKLIGGCMAVETKDSEIRIVQHQDTMSRGSRSIESDRQCNKLFENDQKLPSHVKSYRSSSSVPAACYTASSSNSPAQGHSKDKDISWPLINSQRSLYFLGQQILRN